MKVKEITFALKKGQPNYGSVFASVTMTVEEGDKLPFVWDEAKREVTKQCNIDASAINEKAPNEEVKVHD